MPSAKQPWKLASRVKGLCSFVAAHQRHRDLRDVEIGDHVAEVLVAVRLARGEARRAQRDANRVAQAERGLVAIQVIARRRRQSHQQFAGGVGDRLEAEGLFVRQGVSGAEHDGRLAAQRRDWQRDGQGARLRRIAHACVRAALVPDLERHRGHVAGRSAGLHRRHRLAVGLDLAEELVDMLVPVRQLQGMGVEGGVRRLHRKAMPIQVVAGGDRPGEFHAFTADRLCGQHIGLIDWQQIALVDRPGWRSQQGQCAHHRGRGRPHPCSHQWFA